jgi:hypothetical protein
LEYFYFGLCGDIFLIDCKFIKLKNYLNYKEFRLTHWCQREAYLRLAARESLGQPGVSPWYVDPAKVQAFLPTDEELGDMPIEI